MARRDWGQLGFADHMVMRHGRPNALLTRLTELIDWSGLERIVAGVHDSPHGAPAYPPSAMLKALLLQQWYGLSDPGLEEALWDRLSFRVFCGLPLGETAPDYSTINRFRNALSKDGLDRQVFEAINRQLDQKGLLLRKGTLIDASLIPAAVNPPKKPKEPLPPGPDGKVPSQLVKSKRDPAAEWAKKGGKRYFGYKAHVGIDKGSAIIRRVKLTGASVNDTVPADEMICGDEAAVYADAAYHTHRREAELTKRGIEAHLMRRGNKHHALSQADKDRNKAIGKHRGPVEQVFGRMKTTYRWARARCLGLARNTTHLLLLCTAMNLKRMVVLCAP
jgi:IS5 family transposase